jgi:hypothetical protein
LLDFAESSGVQLLLVRRNLELSIFGNLLIWATGGFGKLLGDGTGGFV